MASILIVDDECSYREELAALLCAADHRVTTAAGSREAIEIGVRYRPDILLTDWMLSDSASGLAITDALRLVHPDLQVIVISGFISHELERSAAQRHVVDLIEKPFEIKRIRAAVARASLETWEPLDVVLPIGLLEVESSGAILWANRFAEELFTELNDGELPNGLAEIFSPSVFAARPFDLLERSQHEWLSVRPLGHQAAQWRIRSAPFSDGSSSLLAVIEAENGNYELLAALRLLLQSKSTDDISWPPGDHVLVIDSDSRHRRQIATILRDAGCASSHVAENADEGLRLLRRDPMVRLVVVGQCRTSPLQSVRKLKTVRPDISIIEC
ncbi:MAG: response regulator [Bdellovibrionota bacterium]